MSKTGPSTLNKGCLLFLGWLSLLLASCVGELEFGEDEPPGVVVAEEFPEPSEQAPDAQRTPDAPAFGEEVLGLWLKRSIVVRAEPSLEGEKLGTLAAHTIVGWKGARQAPGCESRWIEIEPRGWVCEGYLEPRNKSPIGVELPKLGTAEHVPGVYGKVIGEDAKLLELAQGVVKSESPILGSSTVRKRGQIMLDQEPYWKIDGGKFIAESSLRLHEPSLYQGTRLHDGTGLQLPLAFAVSAQRPGDWVIVRDKVDGKRVQRLKARAVVSILEIIKDEEGTAVAYQIGEGKFVAAADLRVAAVQPPPEHVGAHERWFDIDLDTQVLIAYEGSLPVYATLVSSGTRKNPTETGIFRIWIKFSETNMSGRMGETDAYSVATVPWTQFYENDFALHTSYWHDRFGQKRSHGCINLSPRDSRFLYFWSEPRVPKGWSMANGTIDRPGSIVRVHSKVDPQPEFKGYGLRVQQARISSQASR